MPSSISLSSFPKLSSWVLGSLKMDKMEILKLCETGFLCGRRMEFEIDQIAFSPILSSLPWLLMKCNINPQSP